MQKEHVFLAAAMASALVALWMLWPYSDALLWAGFTAYLLHYVADTLNEYVQNRTVTTAIVLTVLVGFVAGLIYFLLTSIPTVVQLLSRFSEVISGSASFFIRLLNLPPSFASSLQTIIQDSIAQSRSLIISQLSALPSMLVDLVIYFVTAAFLVKDGKTWVRQGFEVIGSLPEYYRELAIIVIESIDNLLRGVFISYLAVAATVAFLAAGGFYLLGVDFYWGWGLIIGIFAFFPIVSAPMVYLPLSLLYIGLGNLWTGGLIFAYGVIVLNVLPEVVFRPFFAAQQTQEHPALLFTGFFIGPLVLGFKGIILGPIILVVAKNMLSMKYLKEHS